LGRGAVIGLASLLVLVACENVSVDRINTDRAVAGVAALPAARITTEAARARAEARCAAGEASPSFDPNEEYDQETVADVAELVPRHRSPTPSPTPATATGSPETTSGSKAGKLRFGGSEMGRCRRG